MEFSQDTLFQFTALQILMADEKFRGYVFRDKDDRTISAYSGDGVSFLEHMVDLVEAYDTFEEAVIDITRAYKQWLDCKGRGMYFIYNDPTGEWFLGTNRDLTKQELKLIREDKKHGPKLD